MNRIHNDNSSVKTLVELEINKEQTLDIEDETIPPINENNSDILFIEPFYGGSHKQLIDALRSSLTNSTLVTLTAKKWPWRARCGALIVSRIIPEIRNEKVLFCSSVLNLAELLGLRPDLGTLKKIIYFHENQLVYPIRTIKERDVQYAYNQIISCLSANVVLFNSNFNKSSFLDNISNIMKLLPDFRPKNIREDIENKSKVLYFPVDFPKHISPNYSNKAILHIVWPHRWEFDKDPETFLQVLFKLKASKVPFRVSILGETFKDVPDIFTKALIDLKEEILHFAFLESKEDYYKVLSESHIAVSTAKHEFFGVSMLEAAFCGCLPLVPNKLVYPEIYPQESLYKTEEDLYNKLQKYACDIDKCLSDRLAIRKKINFDNYSFVNLIPFYIKEFV